MSAPPPPSDPTVPSLRAGGPATRLARAYGGLVFLVTCLIVLGASVRAFEAGLACPDWPLCFGEVIPQLNLQVAFEFGHRVLAGSVSLLFLFLAFRTWPRPEMRRHVVLVTVLLGLQIVLGGLTVLQLLAEWTVTSHLVTGNSVNAALLWLALRLGESGHEVRRAPRLRGAGTWVAVTVALAVAQIVLGGLVASSYAGLACPEWPTCNGGLWVPSLEGTVGLHVLHRFNGYALLAALLGGAAVFRAGGRFGRLARTAAGLGLAQVAVGIANVLSGLPEGVTVLHSLLAALLVLTLTATIREWLVSPATPGEYR